MDTEMANIFFAEPHPELEAAALVKTYRRGKCPQSPFADGGHRVGLIPFYSVLDGALPGDSCRWVCLHCEKLWECDGMFYPIAQPNTLGSRAAVQPSADEAARERAAADGTRNFAGG